MAKKKVKKSVTKKAKRRDTSTLLIRKDDLQLSLIQRLISVDEKLVALSKSLDECVVANNAVVKETGEKIEKWGEEFAKGLQVLLTPLTGEKIEKPDPRQSDLPLVEKKTKAKTEKPKPEPVTEPEPPKAAKSEKPVDATSLDFLNTESEPAVNLAKAVEKKAEAQATPNGLTQEAVKAKLQEVMAKHGHAKVESILKKVSVKRVSELQPSHYSTVVTECQNYL